MEESKKDEQKRLVETELQFGGLARGQWSHRLTAVIVFTPQKPLSFVHSRRGVRLLFLCSSRLESIHTRLLVAYL